MASIYPWPERWWTNTGRFSGNDLTVTSGSIFVPDGLHLPMARALVD
nr:MAG TPA: hypothetical protein [Caudoviricetes sp.]